MEWLECMFTATHTDGFARRHQRSRGRGVIVNWVETYIGKKKGKNQRQIPNILD